jgi:PAP2 superfamily
MSETLLLDDGAPAARRGNPMHREQCFVLRRNRYGRPRVWNGSQSYQAALSANQGELPMRKMVSFMLWAMVMAGHVSGALAQDNSAAANAVNPVVEWNRTLLVIVRTKGAQPATVHATRSFAIMHAAIYDAVNAIDGSHEPYLVELSRVPATASQDAAASVAAHDVLSALYPAFQTTLDSQLNQELAALPADGHTTQGEDVGHAVAAAILDLRRDDGSAAQPIPFVFIDVPGRYQSTPPNFPHQPQFTHWSHVTPFVLRRADQFRPGPPPALTSNAYADSFNQVKALGIANSLAATPDEKLIGRFWSGAIQNYWNEIAQTAALRHGLTTAHSARLFALLNLSLADSVIAFYEAKYTYNFWRPVTAIRAADSRANPETQPDPNWLPEAMTTTNDPSYPGAHAAISAAAQTILVAFLEHDEFRLDVTSEVLPGVERHFASFSAAEREASLSRIFAGVHFSTDEQAGETLGRRVADFVIDQSLRPEEHPERLAP